MGDLSVSGVQAGNPVGRDNKESGNGVQFDAAIETARASKTGKKAVKKELNAIEEKIEQAEKDGSILIIDRIRLESQLSAVERLAFQVDPGGPASDRISELRERLGAIKTESGF